jgi:hypothetical protein
VALDRDASFPFQVHTVEDLVVHFPFRERSGQLEKSVGQRALPMIDMRDDAEIANAIQRCGTLV